MPNVGSPNISDSGVFRLLTEPGEIPKPATVIRTKRCSRCNEEMSHTATICPRCQLYLRVSQQTWRVALEDALRYLRSHRTRG